MNDNRNQQQDNNLQDQNPTLNSPGSKVADYGNPSGGSGSDTAPQQQGNTETQQQQEGARGSGNNETIGNP